MKLFRIILILVVQFIICTQADAKRRITPDGTIINFSSSLNMSEIYTQLRIYDAVTSKYLGMMNTPDTRIIIDIVPLLKNKAFTLKHRRANSLSLKLNNDISTWISKPLIQEDILRLMVGCKLGIDGNKETIPQWFVCALRQAAIHKKNFRTMIKFQPLPHMRTLLLRDCVPDLSKITQLTSHSRNQLLAEISEQACYVLLLSLATNDLFIAELKKMLFTATDESLSCVDKISSILKIKDSDKLQDWYKKQIEARTISARFPAPSSYTKRRFNRISTITYTTIEGEEKTIRIEKMEPVIEQISEPELLRIRLEFFRNISQLCYTSTPELNDLFAKVLETVEDFNHDDFDDFVEDYMEVKEEIDKCFSKYDKIDRSLEQIEQSTMKEQQALEYITRLNEIDSQVPPPWPALETYLDEIEKSF